MAFLGIELLPNDDGGKGEVIDDAFNVTMAALGPESYNKGRVSVMVEVNHETYCLCSLSYGACENQQLDLTFSQGETVRFWINGGQEKTKVHLTGYYLPPEEGIHEDYDSDEMDSESEDDLSYDEEDSDDDTDGPLVKGQAKIVELNGYDEDDDDEEDSEEGDEEEEEEVVVKGKKRTLPEKTVPAKKAKVEDVKQKKEPTKQQQQKQPQQQEQSKKITQPQQDKTKPKVLPGGLIVQEVSEGTGATAQSGRSIGVYYRGTLKKNGKPFDKCLNGKPFNFKLGKSEVIKGWDKGVVGMKVGGRRRLTVPPALAYGNQSMGPDLPANSTLVFDIELKYVK